MAVFNFALDTWDLKPGLPKALVPVRRNLEHLIRKQHVDGYMVFFNMNICRNNLEDIRQLTEYAREHRPATDYHINEPPMLSRTSISSTSISTRPTFVLRTDAPWTN